MKIKLTFQIPVNKNGIKNGLHYQKSLGDINVSVDDFDEIVLIEYSCTTLEFLEFFEGMGIEPLDYINGAYENHLENLRMDKISAEENNYSDYEN